MGPYDILAMVSAGAGIMLLCGEYSWLLVLPASFAVLVGGVAHVPHLRPFGIAVAMMLLLQTGFVLGMVADVLFEWATDKIKTPSR